MASSTEVREFMLLASEWGSKHGGISTFNRVLAIELARHSKVHVSVFVPQCDQDEVDDAKNKGVTLIRAKRRPGYSDEKDWLSSPPKDLQIDFVIGHGVVLGKQAQLIQESRQCKWIQFVHTDPEELGMFKGYSDRIEKGELKHQDEVELCAMADFIVAVGPKLAEAYRSYLRPHGKDQRVFDLTPGIFHEFSGVVQASEDGEQCRVLAFGRGDADDFKLKGFDIAAKAVGKLDNAILIFVGAGNKEQDGVADNLQQCDIPPERLRVRTFLESRKKLSNLLLEVDVAIMPSRTEGFGLTALEALSAGLPILVGGNSGFGKALAKVPVGSGCVIQSEDPKVWAQEIKKIWAKDRELRLEEADVLRTNYAKKYSWEKQCKDLVEHVVGIAEDEAAPSRSKRKASDNSIPEPGAATQSSTRMRKSSGTTTQVTKRTRVTNVRDGAPQGSTRNRESSSTTTQDTKRIRLTNAIDGEVKSGKPSDTELQELAIRLGNDWKELGRQLMEDYDGSEAKIQAFDTERKLEEKAFQMLLFWRQKYYSDGLYQILFDALRAIGRTDLAEEFCQVTQGP